jgi:hypothetical protein
MGTAGLVCALGMAPGAGAAVTTAAPTAAATTVQGSSAPGATGALTAATRGLAGKGKQVRAKVLKHPRQLTKPQIKSLMRKMYDEEDAEKGRAARPKKHAPLSRGAVRPDARRLASSVLRDSAIPSTAIGGTGNASFTQEPSTDANGANIFQTGNWYAARSTNSGSTWSFVDPFSLFGSGFCCDQVTQYDPGTGRQFWVLQFSDHLVIANASASGSGAFTGWCYWNITPSWFALPAGTQLDYNDMTISNTYVNISTNWFGTSSSGAALVRLPKQPMSTCSGFSYNRLNRSDNFTFKLVPGSTDVLYFGSNWGQTNGSSFRLFAWPENSTSYSWWDRTVASYTFFTRNSGQNCASADGVVKNWCQFADSRVLGAYRSGGVLGFSWNAKQDSTHPFPYSRIVWFNESDKSYRGAGDLWGSWGAIQFLSLAPNTAGRVGGTFAWGGGTGSTHYYPGAAVWSSALTSVATDPHYYLWGAGNTGLYNGLYRWGDYLTVRTYKADTTKWIAAGYAIKGGNWGSAGAWAEPHNVLFSG